MKNISAICTIIFFFLLSQNLFAQSWKLIGNSGTDPSINFVGNTDNIDLVFRTNNLERLRLSSSGNLGIGTATPKSSALLDLTSTTKGVLFPRMTKTQRDAITSPATGLLIYQTNSTPGFYYYSGSSWSAISPKGVNKSLNNLTAPTAVNVDMLPNANNTLDLGNSTGSWRDLYLDGAIYLDDVKFISNAGYYSTFMGYQAGNANTGISNCAFGYNALFSNTATSKTVAIGDSSLFNNGIGASGSSEGNLNVAVGHKALFTNTTGYYNTATGTEALYNNNGNLNTADGTFALHANTYGGENTGLGYYSLYRTTGSSYNTAIGYASGNLFDNGYNNVFVGTNCDVNGDGYYNVISIGHSSICWQSSQAVIGNSSTTSIGGYANWSNFSDVRFKKNIQTNVPGLEFINLLKPITYTLDVDGIESRLHPANVQQKTPDGEIIPNPMENADMKKAMAEKSKIIYTGFAAQEVEQAAQSVGFDFSGVDKPKDDQTGFYGLRYGDFVVPLVKAVQELDVENGKLKTEISDQQKEIEELKSEVKQIQSSMGNQKAIITNQQQATAILYQNIPNPFDHTTTIPFSIPQHCSSASIIISESSTGQTVKTIPVSCSDSEVKFDATEFSNGNYSYSLVVDGKVLDTKSMNISK